MLKNTIKIFAYFDSNIVQKRLLAFTVLFCFISILVLNYAVPMLLDDFVYSLVKFEEKVEFPRILVQIKDFHIFHYFNWGGRTIAHLVANVLLLFPPIVQDVINTLAFMFFIWLIYKIANVGDKAKASVPLFAFLMIFLFIPRFVSDVLWIVGSSNYMWTTLLIFSAIYVYTSYIMGKERPDSMLRILGLFVLGLVAGWTNENMGPTLSVLLFVYCVYFKIKIKKLPKWSLSGLLGTIVGALLLILAPGNKARATVEGTQDQNLLNTFFENITNFDFLFSYYKGLFLPLVGIFILFLVLFLLTNKSNDRNKILFISFSLLIAGHIALLASYLAFSFPLRAYSGMVSLVISSVVVLYANISFKNIYIKIVNLLVLVVMLSSFTAESFRIYKAFMLVSEVNEYRVEQIKEAKKQGLRTVEIAKPILIDYKYEYVEAELFWEIYYQMDKISFSGEEYIKNDDK